MTHFCYGAGNNWAVEACDMQVQRRLEQPLKSLCLALTAWALTCVVVAFDLSPARWVPNVTQTSAMPPMPTPVARIDACATPETDQTDGDADADDDDDDEIPDSGMVDTFLVTPRPSTPEIGNLATPLRYD